MPSDLLKLPVVPVPEGGWLPIREVARQTGVNAITLRAWERRYGLVVPHRTAKGHRLFTREDVARIHSILSWLNRGVAVSQVKSLLDAPLRTVSDTNESDWGPLRDNLLQAITDLAERRVDALINQAMALYPPATLCEQLLIPLLRALDERWQGQLGARMESAFFHAWLRTKLGARIYHNNRQLNSTPVLLVNHSEQAMDPQLWLAAWLLSSADYPVEVFDWSLPAAELALATDRLNTRAVVLYSSRPLNLSSVPKLLVGCQCLRVLAGPSVEIHQSRGSALEPPLDGIHLCQGPLDVLQCVQRESAL